MTAQEAAVLTRLEAKIDKLTADLADLREWKAAQIAVTASQREERRHADQRLAMLLGVVVPVSIFLANVIARAVLPA